MCLRIQNCRRELRILTRVLNEQKGAAAAVPTATGQPSFGTGRAPGLVPQHPVDDQFGITVLFEKEAVKSAICGSRPQAVQSPAQYPV